MNTLWCKKTKSFSDEEKKGFADYLRKKGLGPNIWNLFEALLPIKAPNTDFFYIKAYKGDELVGIGLFLEIQPFDLTESNSTIKNNTVLKNIASCVSGWLDQCAYFSFRFLTGNLASPFFFKHENLEKEVLSAILAFIKTENKADMVIIMDDKKSCDSYIQEGFRKYPAPSEAWVAPLQYQTIGDYLSTHKSLKKHIAQKKKMIVPEVTRGPILKADLDDMAECLQHSVTNSKMSTPLQQVFEKKIYNTPLFSSPEYLFITIRINDKIVGFTNYTISGSHMAAIVGGYNRNYTRNNYIYERLFVSSLDYAIKKGISRLSYGMVDNLTKLRLTHSFDPICLYIYTPKPLLRQMIDWTHASNDIHRLYLIEERDRPKYHGRYQ